MVCGCIPYLSFCSTDGWFKFTTCLRAATQRTLLKPYFAHLLILLKDFRFWLLASVVQRLFFIDVAPLEMGHNWRQTTVCMVARNFLEVDPNIFFPRVDMAGELSGITGMEFPLLNYIIYLFSVVLGYDHWYGRLINLVVTALSQWAFYRYLKSVFNPELAFRASMILLFSLFYMYSRKIMPDTFSMGLCMIGMFSLERFVTTRKWLWWGSGALFVALGVLSKLPSVLVLPLLLPLLQSSNWRERVLTSAALLPGAVASALWYFYWSPHLTDAFGYQHFFMGAPVAETLNNLGNNLGETLKMFYERPLGFSGFLLFMGGLLVLAKQRDSARFGLLTVLLLFVPFVLQTGDNFYKHEYYIIPVIPAMAYVAARALQLLPSRVLPFVLLIVCVEGLARRWDDQFIKRGKEIAHLEEIIEPYVQEDQLVAINSGVWPTALYFAHRKGWIAYNEQLQDPDFVERLRSRGCAFVLVMKKRFGSEIELPYERVLDHELLIIYRLQE